MSIRAQRKDEIWACVLLAGALFLTIGLFTYDLGDTVFRSAPPNAPTVNRTGVVGAYVCEALVLLFGQCAFLFPAILLVWAFSRFLGIRPPRLGLKLFGFSVLCLSSATWTGIGNTDPAATLQSGGVLGLFIAGLMQPYFGLVGSRVVVAALLALSLLLATEFLFVPFLIRVWKILVRGVSHLRDVDGPPAARTGTRQAPRIVRFAGGAKSGPVRTRPEPTPRPLPELQPPRPAPAPRPAFRPAAKIRPAPAKKRERAVPQWV